MPTAPRLRRLLPSCGDHAVASPSNRLHCQDLHRRARDIRQEFAGVHEAELRGLDRVLDFRHCHCVNGLW